MDYNRIRRGMIFWKEGEIIDTQDGRFSGDKYPYVVVSSNERNARNHISIVPIFRMGKPPKATVNYVEITFHNNPAYIMCDTVQTVKGSSLESSQYDGWIVDDIMDKVSDGIRKSLSLEYSARDLMSTSVADHIENIINQIIDKKLEEARATLPRGEIDDVALKISENLESLFDVDTSKKDTKPAEESENKSDVKEEQEYKSESFTEKEIPKAPIRNKWTEDAIIEFLHKCDMATNKDQLEALLREYHFKTLSSMMQTKRNLARKLTAMSS